MCTNNLFSITGCIALAIAHLSAGCAEAPHDHGQVCSGLSATADDPNAMPADVIAYLNKHHWSHMHLDFHVARMWDILGAETQGWATEQGISRWTLQEGQQKSGLEFLAMHRLMLNELRSQFPEHASLFDGWETPPTDPQDPANALPNGATEAFSPNMVTAIDRLTNNLAGFRTDDQFALFLQTTRRPTKTDPNRRATDRATGIHNYMHNRWTDENSPINIGDPAVNLQNQMFWRLHGWVDARWTAYRKAKGRDDATDTIYLQALSDSQAWMDDVMIRGEQRALDGKADLGCAEIPDEVKNIFQDGAE